MATWYIGVLIEKVKVIFITIAILIISIFCRNDDYEIILSETEPAAFEVELNTAELMSDNEESSLMQGRPTKWFKTLPSAHQSCPHL